MKRFLIICIVTVATLSLAASATELILTGSGTADSPYQVSSALEWNNLADYMATNTDSLTGKYVQLTADLDFSTDTIRQLGYGRVEIFNGYLDGNGKTMKGFSAVADTSYFGGIIITAGESSYIHDLTVSGLMTAGDKYCAGVIGRLYGSLKNITSNVTVTGTGICTAGMVAYVGAGASLAGCVNEGSVSSSGTYTAGLIGYGCADATYENCGNKGTVTYTGSTSMSYTAGMMAFSYYCTMTDCYNTGTVQTSSTSSGYATGVLGYLTASNGDTTRFYLKRCYNTGDITSGFFTAGVTGNGTNYAIVTMEDCYNTGNITSSLTTTKSSTYTAGVAAVLYLSSIYRNCWNSGTVTVVACNYYAGVLGYQKTTPTSAKSTYVVGCYNLGNVSASGSGGYCGGIISNLVKYIYLDSCYNTGAISGSQQVGGIVGRLYGSGYVSISNCYNTGDVTATTTYAGGIIGYGYYKDVITNCFNTGNISSTTSQAGGIAGYGAADMTNVYNTGTITGGTLVGGLIGATRAGYTELHNGYSTGTVTCSGENYGNILGHGTDNTTYWGTSNSMSGTYYLTANAATGAATDTASTGLSYAELAMLDLGDGWTAGDNYTYPRLTTLADNDYAKANAAAVVPADGDSYSSITTGFNVGTPDGVTWTASSGSVEIDGNNVTFSESFSGTLTMTATSGDVSVATELTCNVVVSGISDITGGGREVVEERFYNLAGAQVAEPAEDSKAIYIVVKSYSDGITETVKEVR